jgi:hypothetical protein
MLLMIIAIVAAIGTMGLLFMFGLEYYKYYRRVKELTEHQPVMSDDDVISARGDVLPPSTSAKSPISEP